MKKKITKITVFFLLITSLVRAANPIPSFFHLATALTPDIPESQKLMANIIDKTVKEISARYGFMPIGVGMSGQFEHISIEFRTFKLLNKDQVRKILFDCHELLLNNINSCEDIQPYLNPQPFQIENVGISIYLSDKNYDSNLYPLPSAADIGCNGLEYYFKQKGQKYGYKEITKETYEEARALLKATH